MANAAVVTAEVISAGPTYNGFLISAQVVLGEKHSLAGNRNVENGIREMWDSRPAVHSPGIEFGESTENQRFSFRIG